MTAYRTFTRTWWRTNSSWPNGLEPHAGKKNYRAGYIYGTEADAREACKLWNDSHKPGKLSRKMEYEQIQSKKRRR